jgi:hypothetical protein
MEGRASRWELIKILGNTAQFRHWVEDFLLEDGLVSEIKEDRVYYYVKTDRGNLFHSLLKSGNIMRSFLKISGKRLSRV